MAIVSTTFSTAATDLLSQFGESATFTPATGSPVPGVYVLIKEELLEQPGGYDTTNWAQKTTLRCLLADLPREPNRGETFTVDSTGYTVEQVLENDNRFVKMVVST